VPAQAQGEGRNQVAQTTDRRTARLSAALLSLLLLVGVAPAAVQAVAPADPPVLTSPSAGATVNANPILSWDAVTGATKYRVQVSASDTFSPLLYNVDTYNTSATPPTDLPLGNLYWRVAGMDTASALGPFADSNFTKQWGVAPNPTAPADGAVLDYPSEPPLFTWEPLAGAASYELEIDDAADFIGAQRYPNSGTNPNTSFTLIDQQATGQTFYWHVRGKSATTGVVSDWSETRFYSIAWNDVPALTSPTDGSSVEQVVLDWEPVVGAAEYQVQVSPNIDFSNNVPIDAIVTGTRYSPPNGLNNGSYFWRVRARDKESGTTNNGGWSDSWVFTRGWSDRPTPTWPLDGGVPDEPTLRWTPVDHAAYYEIEIANDVNFSVNELQCYTNHTEWTPYDRTVGTGEPDGCEILGFDPGTTYWWHVRGVDSPAKVGNGGLALGLWSQTRSFVYQPGVPQMLTPANGSTVVTPALSWTHVPGEGRYRVTIFKASGGVAVNILTYAHSYTPVNLVAAEGPFSWHVSGVDAHGGLGSIPASDFTFNLAAPSPSTDLDLLTPADGASSVRMPSMTWEPYLDDNGTPETTDDVDADSYSVYYYVGGSDAIALNGGTQLHLAGYTYGESELPLIGKQLGPGTYSWFVRAFIGGSFVQSPTQTFTILAYDEATYTSPEKCIPTEEVCATLRDTPTLDWDDVPFAGGYIVYISQDADFSPFYRVYWTLHTSLTPRESLFDNQAQSAYYWFAQACTFGDIGPCGPTPAAIPSTAFAFQKISKAIVRQSPDPSSVVVLPNEITFSWQDFLATNAGDATQEARQYRFEAFTAADYSTASRIDVQTIDQTTYTPFDKTYPEGPIYWRVQAIDGSQNFLTSSSTVQTGSLTKTSPAVSLMLPANGATVSGVPYLQWTPQAFAAKYEVEIARNGDTLFSSGNRMPGYPSQTRLSAFSPTTAFPAGVYAWRVRRLDNDLRPGPWAPGRTFTLQSSAPSLASPVNGAKFSDNDLLFQWTAVAGVASYRFQTSTASNFGSIYEGQDTVMTSWAPTRQYGDGTYYWRVQVRDAAGNVLATSSARSFTKDGTRPTVTVKAPTSNASITGAFDVTFSEPVTGVSATTFKVNIHGTVTPVPGRVTMPSSTTGRFQPFNPLMPGQSYDVSLTTGIQDLNGNALVPTAWTVRTALLVENTSPAVGELWDRDTNTLASGGGYDASRTAGARTVYTFNGTNVTLLGRRGPDGGNADVYLDGVLQGPVSFYNAAVQWKRAVWSKTGLVNKKHTVDVRVKGTKPTGSSDAWVYVDAFKVGTVVQEETHASQRDSFRRMAAASASGGSYDFVSHLATGDNNGKPTYQLTFKGTGIDWYATKTRTSGTATVYIDGASQGTIDLYAASTTYGSKVYGSPSLADGVHTLRILLTGAKQAASTGTDVSLDRLVVR
jgi:Bacterial Ig-like domain